ncbi:hypothetical protein BO78DRAFT_391938 [Aspergillus sclerotiicarbonarius CBS 121057]|uniref:Uncharacterized protein n=1 Tax=Aspergillus sclerotiicarbonarius (strain CBS 121057 / IBT 28362) TaxID=1448318 RepID=A0A319E9N3_ASPSB|nr:hypothetical protein BO78DRAFT_391938 [Aspergillus sclerotiicarbonarius CBS 121057]
MEDLLRPFRRYPEEDRIPGSPAFSLELRGPEILSRNTPYLFDVTLRRVDDDSQHCLFSWTPQVHGFVASGGFLLLHHTAQGELKPVELPDDNKLPPLEYWRCFPVSLHPPGNVQQYPDIIPDRWLPYLQTGERYVLFWPGQRYTSWCWEENPGGTLYAYIPPAKTDLVLPAGPFLAFTVEDDGEPVATPRGEARPTLIARLECHPQHQVALKDDLVTATLHVTYEASGGRPITFHTPRLVTKLWVWRGKWVDMEGFVCGGGIYDDPDIQVSPGQDRSFTCLHPGETWSHTFRHELITEIDEEDGDEAQVGERVRCLFKGTALDWWDWGTKEDHLATTVTLPCWGGPTVEAPKDNDGRPLVIIPAANPVDLEIV